MKPDNAFDARLAAKKLLREGRSAALATLLPGSGDPYCSTRKRCDDGRRRPAAPAVETGFAHEEHPRG